MLYGIRLPAVLFITGWKEDLAVLVEVKWMREVNRIFTA